MIAEQNGLVLEFAKSCVGTPYIWGGNNKLCGYDCSGFVCDILRSFGGLDSNLDLNCNGLYREVLKRGGLPISVDEDLKFPCSSLVFYGKQNSYRHVSMVVDWWTVIECGGGDESCLTREGAAELGAMVRYRPITHRRDISAVLLPKWPWDSSEGL